MDKKHAEQLLRRYLDGQCSPEEQRLVELWYGELVNNEQQQSPTPIDEERLKKQVWQSMRKRRPASLLRRIAAAAAVLFVVSTGIYLYQYKAGQDLKATATLPGATIQPGGNRAVLTLGDGTQINLDENQEGVVVGTELTYLDGSSVANSAQPDLRRLTLTTPRGGQYRVVLPDGTHAWLNAATTLEFEERPGDGERVVTLTGEAYFDVNSSHGQGAKRAPFKVKTPRQEVTVLGTGFNVSAYAESPQTVTTLVQGRVRVTDVPSGTEEQAAGTWVLEPGFQAVTTATQTQTLAANLESAIGWKNGDFVFDGSSIREIMQQLARWYDIDVRFRGTVSTEAFGGKIARTKDISDVLQVLELTGGVTFAIEDRTVIVNP